MTALLRLLLPESTWEGGGGGPTGPPPPLLYISIWWLMAGEVMGASEPTEQGIGVLGALLLKTEDGVETFGRVEDSPLLEMRSGGCCCCCCCCCCC